MQIYRVNNVNNWKMMSSSIQIEGIPFGLSTRRLRGTFKRPFIGKPQLKMWSAGYTDNFTAAPRPASPEVRTPKSSRSSHIGHGEIGMWIGCTRAHTGLHGVNPNGNNNINNNKGYRGSRTKATQQHSMIGQPTVHVDIIPLPPSLYLPNSKVHTVMHPQRDGATSIDVTGWRRSSGFSQKQIANS